jgi:hypothetical protein
MGISSDRRTNPPTLLIYGFTVNGITEDQKDASRRSQWALCQHWQDLSDFVPVPKCQRHGALNVSGAGQNLLLGLPAPCTNARFACLCHAANHVAAKLTDVCFPSRTFGWIQV